MSSAQLRTVWKGESELDRGEHHERLDLRVDGSWDLGRRGACFWGPYVSLFGGFQHRLFCPFKVSFFFFFIVVMLCGEICGGLSFGATFR